MEKKLQNDTNCNLNSVCSPFRLIGIATLAICLGVATDHWLYAKSNQAYTGTLQVKTISVRAPVEGILQSWELEEGAQVDPHALLCKLDGNDLNYKIQTKQREVERLDARLKTLQAEVDIKLHEQIRHLDRDIYTAELKTADLLQKKHDFELEALAWGEKKVSNNSSITNFANTKPLIIPSPTGTEKTPFFSDRQLNFLLKEEAAVNAVETASAQLELCTTRLEKLTSQKKQLLKNVKRAVGLSEVEIQMAQTKAELKELEYRQQQQNIYSTEQGTVANLRVLPGDRFQAGEVLADLYKMHDAYVIANIPCSAMKNFDLNATVKCLFPNGEQRTGVVTSVALKTEKANSESWGAEPTVPIRIEQTGALWPSVPVGGHVKIIR